MTAYNTACSCSTFSSSNQWGGSEDVLTFLLVLLEVTYDRSSLNSYFNIWEEMFGKAYIPHDEVTWSSRRLPSWWI